MIALGLLLGVSSTSKKYPNKFYENKISNSVSFKKKNLSQEARRNQQSLIEYLKAKNMENLLSKSTHRQKTVFNTTFLSADRFR